MVLKLKLSYDPAISLLGVYPKEIKTRSQRDICTFMFITGRFTIAKVWKQPKCPSIDEWIRKIWHAYTMEYFSAMRKKEILSFETTWMDLKGFLLSEISQTKKVKHCMFSSTCVI